MIRQTRKICQNCAKPFLIRTSLLKHGQGKFCSNRCKTIALSNKLKKRVTVSCEFCGEKFEKVRSRIKRSKGQYCSWECYVNSRRIIKKCGYCGGEIVVTKSDLKYGQGKYCSRKCRDLSRKTKVKKFCEYCGNEFEVLFSVNESGGGRFCSRECSNNFLVGENSPSWKGGLSFGKYCPKFNNDFKERVREFFSFRCMLCGVAQGNRKLSVHHVTYEKDSCCNSSIAMFIPLCASCHGKTNHNRDFWRDYFFTYINLYFDGDSYIGQQGVSYYRN